MMLSVVVQPVVLKPDVVESVMGQPIVMKPLMVQPALVYLCSGAACCGHPARVQPVVL